ncbi:hypothetical protein NQZ68_027544 [Dissostichus eleginoides]|nr:hypothetical protein NQZ68_027544 [Dissostichus eleginoides]
MADGITRSFSFPAGCSEEDVAPLGSHVLGGQSVSIISPTHAALATAATSPANRHHDHGLETIRPNRLRDDCLMIGSSFVPHQSARGGLVSQVKASTLVPRPNPIFLQVILLPLLNTAALSELSPHKLPLECQRQSNNMDGAVA